MSAEKTTNKKLKKKNENKTTINKQGVIIYTNPERKNRAEIKR